MTALFSNGAEAGAGSYLLEVFLATKEAENCEPVTIRNYRTVIERFLATPGIPARPEKIAGDHIALWLSALRREGLGASTVAYHQRHAYVFLGWLYRRGDLPRDPRADVRRVRVPEKRLRSLELENFERLVTVAGHRPKTKAGNPSRVENRLRDVAILHVLWSTGIRRNELSTLDFEDLSLDRRELLIRFGKGKKVRVVPFDARASAALTEYVYGERGRAPGPLFLERGGERLTIGAVACLLRRLSERSGVKVSAHDFRRGFAARVRREGLDVGHTATLLGHETLTMTIHYSKAGKEEAAINAYRRLLG